ncbi:hypothetical protein [Streptomyces sp. NPDC029003]|uniref:hypothetical protein n=1 Tax=Streptomyces sp. NPDC029003 TaxID=3155125 RepID=UPI0033E0099A
MGHTAIVFAPAGDMLSVLSEGGPAGTAYGVHGATALAVAGTAAPAAPSPVAVTH